MSRRDGGFSAAYDRAREQGQNPIQAAQTAARTVKARGNQLRLDGGEDPSPVKLVGVEAVVRSFLQERLRAALPRTSAQFCGADIRRWLEARSLSHIGEASFTRIMRKLNADFAAETRGARPVHVELESKPKGIYRVHKA